MMPVTSMICNQEWTASDDFQRLGIHAYYSRHGAWRLLRIELRRSWQLGYLLLMEGYECWLN